ncbi:MarR family winged helix-turn-helix transcriptional regulator [Actinomadura sp. SCN-SB]|uniref:MarR family winged helix-turn-helix transcriptional regulator n=1 Tax=Actinomadura sp. SCN-SB TaxID=3373092 RepID=UPI0037521BC8
MLDDLLERLLSEAADPATRHVGLGMLLARAHNTSRGAMNRALRPLGIDVRGYTMLLTLRTYGPSSQRRLIDMTGIDKSTMVRLIDELEHAGLVRRERTPQDRRAYSVTPTPEGERVLAEAREIAADVGERIFGRFRPDERDQLAALLRRLVEPPAPAG